MSEAYKHHEEPTYDDNVVPFERRGTNLRSLYANDMTDQEIQAAIGTLDQDMTRHIEAERRPDYILNSVLLALDVTPEMNSLYKADGSPDPVRKADAWHGLRVEKTIVRVREEFSQLTATLDRVDMTDYREHMIEGVSEKMADTNLYRAFNFLKENAIISHEVRMNGLVQAHRLSYALLYDHILNDSSDK